MSEAISVLFVDDEVSILKSIERQIREMPYRCTFESDPEKALSLMKELSFDVLVSDERMPHLTGTELISRAKKIDEHLVCIMLTGEMSVKKIIKAMNDGVVFKYLTKPCNVVEVVQSIESAVRVKAIKARVLQLIDDYKRKCQTLDDLGDIAEVKRDQSGAIDLGDLDLDLLMKEMESFGL